MNNSYDTKSIEIFPWSENFSVGIQAIDDQHKILVNLINQLVSHVAYQADKLSIDKVVDELIAYTEYHFSEEELIWTKYFGEDTWLQWHQHAHGDFKYQVKSMFEAAGTMDPDDAFDSITKFLTHWLANHILESDKRMAKVALMLPSGISLARAKEISDQEMSGSTRLLIDTIMTMYDKLANNTVQMSREIHIRSLIEAELKQAKLVAEQINLQKSNFLSYISHEIRAPLSAISIATHLVSNGQLSAMDNALKTLENSFKHLGALADDILDFSKIEASAIEINYCLLDLDDLLVGSVSIVQPHADQSNVAICIDNQVLSGLLLYGDLQRLQQCTINYLSNAIKYGRSAKILLTASYDEDEQTLEILVRDSGPHLSGPEIATLFTPFQTVGDEQPNPIGCGLGLAINKGLAELMRGSVGFRNLRDTGKEFWFTAYCPLKKPQKM